MMPQSVSALRASLLALAGFLFWVCSVTASAAPVNVGAVTGHVVRVAYVVPSNRTAQTNAVPTLRHALLTWQKWYADQMSRNRFGAKTFRFETESDGITPKVHVVSVTATDDYLRGDLWDRTLSAAGAAGIPVWTNRQVWLLIPETHIESPDGDITGGTSLGASSGSGDDAGVAMIASDALARLSPPYLTNNAPYDNQVIAEIGPYPLKQNVSYASFLGTTFSSISSTPLGAGLHELSHAFGAGHDFRNDQNFKGNLMGNGFRGMRGSLYPELYPADFARASYASALGLSVSRYFNTDATYTDNTKPTLTITTSGTNTPVNGLVQIQFSTSDTGGLYAAWLQLDGEMVGEMRLTGTTTNAALATPYFTPGGTNTYTLTVVDTQGNRRSVDTSVIPRTGFNRAPRALVTLSTQTAVVDQEVVFSAANSTDPDGSLASMQVEWDLDGLGSFRTPTTSKTLTNRFTSSGTRLIRVRLTDSAGGQSLSTSVALQVNWPTLDISRVAGGVQLSWTTNAKNFLLQQSTNPPMTSWGTATQAVTLVGSQKQVLITNTLPRQFFRLMPVVQP